MLKTKKRIPSIVIPRMSLYYRALLESRGSDLISSEELAMLTGLHATQIRKDLTYFGQFGIPGKGYKIEDLKQKIVNILGTDRRWNVALVGAGNLGSALLAYRGFAQQGFEIVCAFDNNQSKTGSFVEGIKIQDIEELPEAIKDKNIKMAILAVPAGAAQGVVNTLTKSGVRAILNFAPLRPQVRSNVELLNIDLSIELERLAFFLKRRRPSA